MPLLQKFSEHDVPHPEAQRGQIGTPERLQQPVVAAAAADRPELFCAVEQLEHDAGVVGQPADDREIDLNEIAETHCRERLDRGAQRLPGFFPALHFGERVRDRVDPTQRGDLENGLRLARPASRIPQHLREGLFGHPLTLVDHPKGGRQLRLHDAMPEEQCPQYAPVGDSRLYVLWTEPEGAHDVEGRRDQLGVGEGARFADDVHVELEVLPQAPSLLPFVAKQLRHGEPTDRLLERLGSGGHHPDQAGRHLGTEGDVPVALVLEGV